MKKIHHLVLTAIALVFHCSFAPATNTSYPEFHPVKFKVSIFGNGYFLVKRNPDDTVSFATRSGDFELIDTPSQSNLLAHSNGWFLQGLNDGAIGYHVAVDSEGNWYFTKVPNELGGAIVPTRLGSISLDFDPTRASEHLEPYNLNSDHPRNAVFYVNRLYDPEYWNGVHNIGFVERTNRVQTRGWHTFAMDAVAGLLERRNEVPNGAQLLTDQQISQAVSNDFFFSLYPEQDHGLSGVEISEALITLGIHNLDTIESIQNLIPHSIEAARLRINQARSLHAPKLTNFSIDPVGIIRFFLSDGNSFIRARVLIADFKKPFELEPIEDGLLSWPPHYILDREAPMDPSAEGYFGNPGDFVLGRLLQGYTSLPEIKPELDKVHFLNTKGSGYFRLIDLADTTRSFVSKEVYYRINEADEMVDLNGFHLEGLSGGAAGYHVSIDDRGKWSVRQDDRPELGTSPPFEISSINLSYDPFSSVEILDIDREGESELRRNGVFYTNQLVDFTRWDGEHSVGSVYIGPSSIETKGWHAFAEQAVEAIKAQRDLAPENDLSDEEIEQAVSDDFFAVLFEDQIDEHGIANPNSNDRGAINRILNDFQSLSVSPYIIRAIHEQLIPQNSEEAKQIVKDLRSRNTPTLERTETRKNGEIVFHLSDGIEFVRAQLLLMDFYPEDQVQESGNGLHSWSLGRTRTPEEQAFKFLQAPNVNTVGEIEYSDDLVGDSARLINLSARATIGEGHQSLIVGIVPREPIEQTTLVRGIGPILETFGVVDALQDPRISFYGNGKLLDSNENWGDQAWPQPSIISLISDVLGAFPINDSPKESAMFVDIEPGLNSIVTSGSENDSGTGLTEVFFRGSHEQAQRFSNVSARGLSQPGNPLVLGLTIEGDQPLPIMVRVLGPALQQFGLQNYNESPRLEVYSGSVQVGEFDKDSKRPTFDPGSIGASSLFENTPENVIVNLWLEPGVYTFVAPTVGSSPGLTQIEVFLID